MKSVANSSVNRARTSPHPGLSKVYPYSRTVGFRLSLEEHELLSAEARRCGTTIGLYARTVVLAHYYRRRRTKP